MVNGKWHNAPNTRDFFIPFTIYHTLAMLQGREIEQLLTVVDQAYDHVSWHGTSLRGSVRRVNATLAAWRPGKNRHNIWEITVHAAYWKYAVWRRLTAGKAGSFELTGSNWFRRPETLTEAAWRSDVAMLDRWHVVLRKAIADLPPSALHRRARNSKVTNHFVITGIAAHDLYHAGQIQLLKKLAR